MKPFEAAPAPASSFLSFLFCLSSFVLVLGCDGLDGPGDGADAGLPVSVVAAQHSEQFPPFIAPSPDLPPAFDPRLDGFTALELAFDVANHHGVECTITVARDGALVRELDGTVADAVCAASWDARDEDGVIVHPGSLLTVTATLPGHGHRVESSTTIEVVRLGIEEIALDGEGRAPLLYARMGGVAYGYYEVAATTAPWRMRPDATEPAGATPLEFADGTTRPRPMPWDDVLSPPLDGRSADGVEHDTYNLPTAWTAGSPIRVRARFSTAWAGGIADPHHVEVRAVAPPGLTGEAIIADGAEGTFDTTSSLVPAVGRYDVALSWRFEARRPGGAWIEIPGAITTVHRLYGLVAPPTFDYDEIPHRAWVHVVDRVTEWIGGASSTPDDVAARIVDGIFHKLGLQYDVERGASFYTWYPLGTWNGANFELTRFVGLENGHIINCSDAASILSTYANMVGIDLRYHIIQHRTKGDFALNYLYAIGRGGFAASPFTSGIAAFSYHAITGPPDTRVYDATLALDGDGRPDIPPHTTLLVQGLPQYDYLVGLSPEFEELDVFIDEKVRIR